MSKLFIGTISRVKAKVGLIKDIQTLIHKLGDKTNEGLTVDDFMTVKELKTIKNRAKQLNSDIKKEVFSKIPCIFNKETAKLLRPMEEALRNINQEQATLILKKKNLQKTIGMIWRKAIPNYNVNEDMIESAFRHPLLWRYHSKIIDKKLRNLK